jgi:hypothetical protein
MTKHLLWAVGLSLLGLVVCAPHAHADTITTFDVSGSATNITTGSLGSCGAGATCAFSGTLSIDVTSGTVNVLGTVENVDITFPGLASFTTLAFSSPLNPFDGPNWEIDVDNSDHDRLGLHFTTMNTPASLVGFTGGSISGVSVALGSTVLYTVSSGSITPASTATPEPSSLVLMFFGLGALALIVRPRLRVPC